MSKVSFPAVQPKCLSLSPFHRAAQAHARRPLRLQPPSGAAACAKTVLRLSAVVPTAEPNGQPGLVRKRSRSEIDRSRYEKLIETILANNRRFAAQKTRQEFFPLHGMATLPNSPPTKLRLTVYRKYAVPQAQSPPSSAGSLSPFT